SQPAHQAGHLITQDVAEHVGGHHDIELLGTHHQLHGGVVDNHVVGFDPAFVFLGDGAAHLEKQSAHHFQDIGLVYDGNFAAAVLHGVLEGVADDSLAATPGDDRHGLGHRAGIVSNGDEVLHPDVKPLEVLPNQHDVHVFETSAGND